jgi:hypothetical protein
MNCPEATGTVLSREFIQAPGGMVVRGVDRAQYTIGITGCGQR